MQWLNRPRPRPYITSVRYLCIALGHHILISSTASLSHPSHLIITGSNVAPWGFNHPSTTLKFIESQKKSQRLCIAQCVMVIREVREWINGVDTQVRRLGSRNRIKELKTLSLCENVAVLKFIGVIAKMYDPIDITIEKFVYKNAMGETSLIINHRKIWMHMHEFVFGKLSTVCSAWSSCTPEWQW